MSDTVTCSYGKPSYNPLESLVPELELCKKIPDERFENSAMAWDSDYESWYVVPRGIADPLSSFPAPTAIEILSALQEIGAETPSLSIRNNSWTADCWARIDPKDSRLYHVCIDDPNPAAAAMKLWMQIYSGCDQ